MTDPIVAASESSPEDADRLVAVLPAEGQEAMVQAWLEAEDAERLRALADGAECDAATRKLARKSLHILRTRGVEVPEAARTPAPATVMPPKEPDQGWLSSVDGTGHQAFILAYGVPGGGFRGVVGVRGGAEGLSQAVPFDCAKRRLKELVEHGRLDLGGYLLPVDAAYVRWRLERAIRVAVRAGASTVDRVAEAARSWPAAPGAMPPHPVRSLALPSSAHVGPQTLDEADAVLATPELRGWSPPAEALDALLAALEDLDVSLIVVSREAMLERWVDTILDAVAEHFPEDARRDFALDLEDVAFFVATREGRATEAASILRAAADVRDVGIPPAEVGFLRLYFERCLPPPPSGGPGTAVPPKRSKGGVLLP